MNKALHRQPNACVLQAGCKANLYLEILDRRENGLHEIRSLFYPLQHPSDELRIETAPAGSGFSLSCSRPELQGEQNILHAVYDGYGQRTGYWPDIHVHLQKGIPHGSGLGGASSDAAAFLQHLQAQADSARRLPDGEMIRLAAGLGSDVPFFLRRAPAWVTGAGESVNPVGTDLRGWHLLVLCPDVRVSTAWAYRQWDAFYASSSGTRAQPLTDDAFRYKESFCSLGRIWKNGFEAPVFQELPQLGSFKESLYSAGARAAVLSGSGASLIGLFKGPAELKGCTEKLAAQGVDFFVNSL